MSRILDAHKHDSDSESLELSSCHFMQVGTIHKNKANRRKSRLAFAKKSVEIALGLYTPPPPTKLAAVSTEVADEDQADKMTVVTV